MMEQSAAAAEESGDTELEKSWVTPRGAGSCFMTEERFKTTKSHN